MTPKEKAQELVGKNFVTLNLTLDVSYPYSSVENVQLAAERLALIAVNEILDVLGGEGVYSFADDKIAKFYEQVKVEIEKL